MKTMKGQGSIIADYICFLPFVLARMKKVNCSLLHYFRQSQQPDSAASSAGQMRVIPASVQETRKTRDLTKPHLSRVVVVLEQVWERSRFVTDDDADSRGVVKARSDCCWGL